MLYVGLATISLCKEFWQCDNAGQYRCGKQQTCCKGPVGYKCYNVSDGQCCSNGISACPKNMICNIKENKCDPKTIIFLESDPTTKIIEGDASEHHS